MAAVATHLADTSALARLRHSAVASVLGPLIEAGLVGTCGVIEFELGWAARTADEFDEIGADRQAGDERLATSRRRLAPRPASPGRPLAPRTDRAVGFPDLLIAAIAERERLTILHYDSDYDLITRVTGQTAQWVVPRGTVP